MCIWDLAKRRHTHNSRTQKYIQKLWYVCSSWELSISVVFHLGRVWWDKLFPLDNKKKKEKEKESHHRMVILTRGSGPCTDYKRRKSLRLYFSLQHWCTVYSVLYRKKIHVVLSRTEHPWWILLAISDTFSRLYALWFLDTSLLFFPEDRRKSVQGSLLMSEERKNEDRLNGLSMLHNLQMCPFSSCFLSPSSWCSWSIDFYFFRLFCSVFCVMQYTVHTYIHKEKSLFITFITKNEMV